MHPPKTNPDAPWNVSTYMKGEKWLTTSKGKWLGKFSCPIEHMGNMSMEK